MKEYIEKRAIETGEYILETKDTVRSAAKVFNVSKSTVHKDLTERLKKIDKGLYNEVAKVLEFNKAERHIRGGNATHLKYKGKKKKR
ncbi:MAG: sporulation transcriptional regulator SpoIIID [Clostridia bacterium]|nr:sporulation transcriptional regulator SpoIIID [Clostridia bacterium]